MTQDDSRQVYLYSTIRTQGNSEGFIGTQKYVTIAFKRQQTSRKLQIEKRL